MSADHIVRGKAKYSIEYLFFLWHPEATFGQILTKWPNEKITKNKDTRSSCSYSYISSSSSSSSSKPTTTEPYHFLFARPVSLNIEALFRCMDCSPCLPISISFPPAERLNLIRTHWCVDNEGVTRSWERPSNSPHRGSGFLGGVWMSTPAPWCMHSCELVTAFTQIQGQA